jgi:hypothetical protein
MSEMNSPKNILLQIITEAENKNPSFGKTCLVKLLYLVEVEYYREFGTRLTDLRWVFYHYGPYALELDSILAENEFEKEVFTTKTEREVIHYKIAEPLAHYSNYVDTKLSLIVKKVVGTWAGKKLNELLDYVYFETEPMEAVRQRGDILDFSTIQKEASANIIPLKASKETEVKVAELRKRIAPKLERFSKQITHELHRDKDYEDAVRAWDEDSNKEINPEALQNITLTITQLPDGAGKKGN